MGAKKDIKTLGYTIPTMDASEINLYDNFSLMDADIFLISPVWIYPTWTWIDFSSWWGSCLDVSPSKNFIKRISHLKKELSDFLDLGKTVVVFLSKEKDYLIADSVSSVKNNSSYSTRTISNYDFLPLSIGKLDPSKVLWAIYKVWEGHLVILPYLGYDESNFTEYLEEGEKEIWNKDGVVFWNNLLNCLVNIDKNLLNISEATPKPEWSLKDEFSTKQGLLLQRKIQENNTKIEQIEIDNKEKEKQLEEENILKWLLFEQWKSLEKSVIKALEVLGYQAEGYDDWELELDQIILSPEGYRFIGECEWKDKKAIDIKKFRQLFESLHADFERDEVEEKAFGILFWNPERLLEPTKRTLDFTVKCKKSAEREKIALIKTIDLFRVCKYLNDNKNKVYKKACRDAIYNWLEWVVIFPDIPKK